MSESRQTRIDRLFGPAPRVRRVRQQGGSGVPQWVLDDLQHEREQAAAEADMDGQVQLFLFDEGHVDDDQC